MPFRGRGHGSDKTIPLPGHCLNETWATGVIFQRLTKLPDRAPDAVVGIEENTFAPDPRDDFVAGNDLVFVLNEQSEDLQGYALEPDDMPSAAQTPRTNVELVIFAEPDRLFDLSGIGGHGALQGKWMNSTTHSESSS